MSKNALNVQSVGRALGVLQVFNSSKESESELSLTDIVRLTGYDKSAVQRFTYTLELHGYLVKNPATKRYSLGFRVLDLAFDFLRNNSFLEVVNPHLIDLCQITGERVSLSLYDTTTLIYAIRHQTRPDYYFSSLIGRRIPTCFSAGGRTILSLLPQDEIDDIIKQSDLTPYTAKTIAEPHLIQQEIEKARSAGYARSVEEITYGEVGLGAAIVDKSGRPIAALHLIGSTIDWTPDGFETKYATQLLETVQRISGR